MQTETKQSLRTKLLQLMRSQTEEDRRAKSDVIQKKLFALKEFEAAKTVLFYAAFDGEVETGEMIHLAQEMGKIVCLPRAIQENFQIIPMKLTCSFNDLGRGAYGIKEPTLQQADALSCDLIDLVVVPGVGFDRDRFRLGRGAGYYDRFLVQLASNISTVGLAYDCQIVEQIPQKNSYDIPVKILITN